MLDSFFGNVCELDLVFNFYKVRACVFGSGEGLERGDGGGEGEGIGEGNINVEG